MRINTDNFVVGQGIARGVFYWGVWQNATYNTTFSAEECGYQCKAWNGISTLATFCHVCLGLRSSKTNCCKYQ
jgi:hypothetical protein